ncbi:MAG: cell division protein FtsI [Lachnospiraceae bacterium]|nr:cell division protein FtsI [Lachnospiraceae bacterium]
MRYHSKIGVLMLIVLLLFVALSVRLVYINTEEGEEYKRQILSQQKYDSVTIPYKRGDILDTKGSVLATSEKVYNVILDTKLLRDKEERIEPTLEALEECFGLDGDAIEDYMDDNPNSQYYVLKKQLTYEEISPYVELRDAADSKLSKSGIWFEDEYKRIYPNNTLACDVIGFTGKDNKGMYGLEEFYSDTLNGVNGREYGYLNTDSDLERTIIPAVDGYSIQSTIDLNIQSIVEKYILEFNEAHKNEARDGLGSNNTGCIVMEVNTGKILAMASYPNYDLNNPYDLGAYYTEAQIQQMKDEDTYGEKLNSFWKNFCINETYEPGSVSKLFTVAAGLETGALSGNEYFTCNGHLNIGDYKIRCHNTYGDGEISVKQAVAESCNVALMHMAAAVGKDRFLTYQELFNFGLKTNIDLAGESRTASLVHTVDTLGETELATSSFGQGFNVTMIQEITAFCSLINGGNYYEPHMVERIISADGSTVENITPRVLKQTVSEETSQKLIEYCNAVVTEGTGKTARPAGYAIGGKTGTAQTFPRGNGEYVVSFMGYAPADNPQIAIYVVVDRPNVARQDDAKFATGIVRNVLTEVLPYLNIYMTEELSEKEQQELEERQREERNKIWYTFPIDPETGYAVDPNTGEFVDPETGDKIYGDDPFMEEIDE